MATNVSTRAKQWLLGSFLLVFFLFFVGCDRTSNSDPATPSVITFIGWGPATQRELSMDQSVFEQFSRETGIRVDFIPGPESMTERLELYERYLGKKSSTPDVYYIDVVWPAVLADQMVDLNQYLAKESADQLETEVRNDTVNGRLTSMPFNTELGVLYYRSDLLRKYGYRNPPATWDELEKMAARIQAGERAGGNKDFWGYVWEGAAYEGLTCNALEWQVGYGGGYLIEADGSISVNNPRTIEAMKSARRWIGTISPPSVIAFKEQDARNLLHAGKAAFERDWLWRQFSQESMIPNPDATIAIALLPGGSVRRASTIGGQSLAVSKYSRHPQEAAALVRYLTSHDEQLTLWKKHAMLPARRDFYASSEYLQDRPEIAQLWRDLASVTIARPSAVSGQHYDEVSRAYFSSVHSILAGEQEAGKAMAELQAKLEGITGGKPGPPPGAGAIH
ncbi:MAG TPA: extracellular solute-binding protein [Candidatus Sulfotelmatobacter sp.]|jgi:trehalose/maltose transport system substrate-binding protein|nr:extracellular solute-binding protein [Candidatus Sulfotelmatobacter sp.]